MGLENSSLKPVNARMDGAGVEESPGGNHISSVIQASFYYIDQAGDLLNWEFTVGDTTQVLLFTTDYPLATLFISETLPGRNNKYEQAFIGDLAQGLDFAGGSNIYTPDYERLAVRQVGKGVTLTNNVRVSGYYFTGFINNDAEPTLLLYLYAWAAGATLSGYQPFTYIGQFLTDDFIQQQDVIMHEASYTQEMKDAGNVIDVPSPFFGSYRCRIVGLFNETNP